jgi:hypothetical protein
MSRIYFVVGSEVDIADVGAFGKQLGMFLGDVGAVDLINGCCVI